jgi:hypothetical protein
LALFAAALVITVLLLLVKSDRCQNGGSGCCLTIV